MGTSNFAKQTQAIGLDLKTKFKLLIKIVVLLWAIELVDLVIFQGRLNYLGIHPHSIFGLPGIFLAPFLHASFGHLMANTIPFIILGYLVILDRVRDFFSVSLIVTLTSGIGVWLIAPSNSIHIGASGVIFGYLGFLLFRGYFDRSFSRILISVLVGLFYGGMIWGVLPTYPGVSWQSHLFGFLGGILAAKIYAK